MPLQYKFTNTVTGNDIILETDASDISINNFTITQIRGLGSTEIRAGFNLYEGQQEVYQDDLVTLARDTSLGLELWENGERQSVLNDVTTFFGIYNGTTSRTNFTLPPIGDEFDISISIDIRGRFTVNPENSGAVFLIGPDAITADSIRGTFISLPAFPPDGGATQGMQTVLVDFAETQQVTTNSTQFAVNADFHTFLYRIVVNATGNATLTISRDGTQIATSTAAGFTSLTNFAGSNQPFFLGYINSSTDSYFEGDMRNLVVTNVTDGIIYINCPDPSTGVNFGTQANGVPVNVTQGSE